MPKYFLKLSVAVLIGLGALGIFLFFSGAKDGKLSDGVSLGGEKSGDSIVINNQGGSMEGHTPRGFKGMGTGLFAGDNLNPNFPSDDGVQLFLTLDLGSIPTGASVTERTGFRIVSATLRSRNVHIQGSPFKNLGELKVETVTYDTFSSALWNIKPDSFVCAVTDIMDDTFECDVTSAIQQALENGSRFAQFRINFEKASNSDGQPDLVMFYKTNSNTNESGIFQIEVKIGKKEASSLDAIHIPLVLHLVKMSGAADTRRQSSAVQDLFKKSQAIWNSAGIVFDVSIVETVLDDDTQKALLEGNFGTIYKVLPVDSKTLHVFFVKTLAGPNGIAIAPALALVADETTVNDFRATAHEIGHLLGLSHTDASEERLLFRGVNGTKLTQEEVNIARLQVARLNL